MRKLDKNAVLKPLDIQIDTIDLKNLDLQDNELDIKKGNIVRIIDEENTIDINVKIKDIKKNDYYNSILEIEVLEDNKN